jgi:starch phosphorylase
MEIGLDPRLPSYAGGLGILAGDTVKSFADLGVPIIAVTLLNEEGYFHQDIDSEGNQHEIPVVWKKEDFLTKIPEKVKIQIEGRDVYIGAWTREVHGINGQIVPVIFLDANLPENSDWDRNITKHLYGGDRWYRLCQEIVLGIGGFKMLKELGYDGDESSKEIIKYHMNEGHAAFLVIELLEELKNKFPNRNSEYYYESVREKCVFTTHTPIPAGHDIFEYSFVENALRNKVPEEIKKGIHDGKFNMTMLALKFSKHVNGVAKKHGEVSSLMFPGYQIDAITNGVHSVTWTGNAFKSLYDEYIPGWRKDSFMLRYALNIPPEKIWQAHVAQKKELIDYVNKTMNKGFDYDSLTIGFGRRVAPYKRIDFLARDLSRLKQINHKGKIQIIVAGKAHPSDTLGKELLKEMTQIIKSVENEINIVFLPNYEMWLGQLMTSGVDIWLNTPKRPQEASGTSGMKAAHNGVLNFSILDGWWIEGHVEDVTGWSIGAKATEVVDEIQEVNDFYNKLDTKIVPLFYNNKTEWVRMMLHSISHNASFFNTQRMVSQYVTNCYFS